MIVIATTILFSDFGQRVELMKLLIKSYFNLSCYGDNISATIIHSDDLDKYWYKAKVKNISLWQAQTSGNLELSQSHLATPIPRDSIIIFTLANTLIQITCVIFT